MDILMHLLPAFTIGLFVAIFNYFIARRKTYSPVWYAVVSIIYPIGLALSVYLASLTDKVVLEKLDLLLQSEGRKQQNV